jgi:hypothetical protein
VRQALPQLLSFFNHSSQLLQILRNARIQVLRMDGVVFTGDISIMTKLMSISFWHLERSVEEDLLLQTMETLEGFRVATRGLLTIPSRECVEVSRAVYCMEFELQVNTFQL